MFHNADCFQQLQQIQIMLQRQLLNYQLTQIYQNSLRQSALSSNGNKTGGIGAGLGVGIGQVPGGGKALKEPGSTFSPSDNRPSVYNRRISSEQIELPDGRLCTRVPARKWSKVI